MSLHNLTDTAQDRDRLLALDTTSKQLKPLLKSVLSYDQLNDVHKSAFLRLVIEAEAEG